MPIRRRQALTSSLIATLVSLAMPARFAHAEGVLEINQACAVQTGCFATDAPGFPVTIGQPGSYRLTSSLDQTEIPAVTTPTTAVEIDSNDVTLDLGGFVIRCTNPFGDCSGAADGVLAVSGANRGLRVHDGIISGMPGNGVDIGGIGSVVRDLHVRDVGGVGIGVGTSAIVEDNVIFRTGGSGIAAANDSTVRNNSVRGTAGDGVRVQSGSLVISNVITGAGDDGIWVNQSALVEGNVLTEVTNVGILGDSALVLFRDNSIQSSGAPVSTIATDLGGNFCNGSTSCP